MKKRKGYFQYESEHAGGHRSLGTYLSKRKFRDSRLDHFANNRRRRQYRLLSISALLLLILFWFIWHSVKGLSLYYTHP